MTLASPGSKDVNQANTFRMLPTVVVVEPEAEANATTVLFRVPDAGVSLFELMSANVFDFDAVAASMRALISPILPDKSRMAA